MSDAGEQRRRRLKALKEKANKSIKFRNYRPQDAAIRDQAGSGESTSAPGKGDKDKRAREEGGDADEADEKRRAPAESLIQQELKKQKAGVDEEELNIAPKKVNWDLKRDVEKKLEKLNRRTQRAIVEIIRGRLAEEAEKASESSSSEEDGSDSGSGSGSGSGSESSGEEESGSDSEDDG